MTKPGEDGRPGCSGQDAQVANGHETEGGVVDVRLRAASESSSASRLGGPVLSPEAGTIAVDALTRDRRNRQRSVPLTRVSL